MTTRPRVAAFYCVFDDDEWLACSIASIYPVVDAIFFLVGNAPWNGPLTDNRMTLQTIEAVDDPANKCKLFRGDWKTEVDQRNWAMALIEKSGFDYGLIIDADEVYDSAALSRVIDVAAANPDVCCWHCWFIVYWKSPLFRIDPPEKHHPPVLLKVGSGGFAEYRNCLTARHELIPAAVCYCHHLSYARTDAQILRKIHSFSHSHQIPPDWFERVWKGWDADRSITDLCPYNPGAFERAVPVAVENLPPVLQAYVSEHPELQKAGQ